MNTVNESLRSSLFFSPVSCFAEGTDEDGMKAMYHIGGMMELLKVDSAGRHCFCNTP